MGQIEEEQGNYDEAINHYVSHLEIHRLYFSENTTERAHIYSILGIVFLQKKYY
jgi:hypothetical protein